MGTLSGSGSVVTRVARSRYERPSESHEKVVVDEVVHLDHDDPNAPVRIERRNQVGNALRGQAAVPQDPVPRKLPGAHHGPGRHTDADRRFRRGPGRLRIGPQGPADPLLPLGGQQLRDDRRGDAHRRGPPQPGEAEQDPGVRDQQPAGRRGQQQGRLPAGRALLPHREHGRRRPQPAGQRPPALPAVRRERGGGVGPLLHLWARPGGPGRAGRDLHAGRDRPRKLAVRAPQRLGHGSDAHHSGRELADARDQGPAGRRDGRLRGLLGGVHLLPRAQGHGGLGPRRACRGRGNRRHVAVPRVAQVLVRPRAARAQARQAQAPDPGLPGRAGGRRGRPRPRPT